VAPGLVLASVLLGWWRRRPEDRLNFSLAN
jgi:hypothetical protein